MSGCMLHQMSVRLYPSIILFITVLQRLCVYMLPFLLSRFSFNTVLKSPPIINVFFRPFLLSIFLIVRKKFSHHYLDHRC